ncbi:hypothetical protein DL770_011572 [Monosporascus sp. CRB-9-2]|nr:hypothetical protein DL770_011572 [Monosporascus sp. CRB-9-2]
MSRSSPNPQVPVRKLVLCFDGTGNTFSGSSGDTNIVKLYDKFDRDDPRQFHYYQTGIGTYDVNGGSVNKGFLGSIRSAITRTLDSGFGTSFDHHVMAGYKFLMNHYNHGDKIYMFGFSRGAFTARFLARMINGVGLLSVGNDEMVPFAYALYQRYEQGHFEVPSKEEVIRSLANAKDALASGIDTINSARAQLRNRDSSLSTSSSTTDLSEASAETDITVPAEAEALHYAPIPTDAATQQVVNEMKAFRNTFCREVKVYFLGIFDCVNSVSVLGSPSEPATVLGTAEHVRHAVAVDEFRVKFKPALLHQDVKAYETASEKIKEVWFPGNHGDVGGGWPIAPAPEGFWSTVKRWFSGDVQKIGTSADPGLDDFQMSDIPLDWMIRELELVNAANPKEWAISFGARKDGFRRMLRRKDKLKQAKEGRIHNTMSFSGGSNMLKAILWNVMARYELESGKWVKRYFPLNAGDPRDIPRDAIVHQSLIDRISNAALAYRPQNNHGGKSRPCLLDKEGKNAAQFHQVYEPGHRDELHRIWTFA